MTEININTVEPKSSMSIAKMIMAILIIIGVILIIFGPGTANDLNQITDDIGQPEPGDISDLASQTGEIFHGSQESYQQISWAKIASPLIPYIGVVIVALGIVGLSIFILQNRQRRELPIH